MSPTCARPGCRRAAHSRSTGLCGPHFRQYAGPAYDRVPIPADAIRAYRAAGYTDKGVCTAAGVSVDAIRRAFPDGRVSRFVRDAIVNVDLEAAPSQPCWRATRRVRALAALGVSYKTIAEEAGLSASYLAKVAGGQPTRMNTTAFRRLNAVWEARRDDPAGPVDERIARRGWAVPFEWDDIDGPEDLHADALVCSRTARHALEAAVTTWGRARALEITGLNDWQYQRVRKDPRIRESMRARVIGAINREKWRIDANRRNHMKAAA